MLPDANYTEYVTYGKQMLLRLTRQYLEYSLIGRRWSHPTSNRLRTDRFML